MQIIHILIIDDDTRIRDLLSKFLIDNDFFVTTAKDTQDARLILGEFKFDLLIVDVMMPGETGIEFTQWLHQNNYSAPILMLTAMGEVSDRIAGLESGADDYLQKPFEPRELLLRIQNLLKRTRLVLNDKIYFGDMVFEISRMSLLKNNQNIAITTNEAILLTALCKKIGSVVSREEMAMLCGGVNERTIDVQITRLRSKIEDNPKKPIYLKSVRGKGYALYT